jgi:hypothetical protein
LAITITGGLPVFLEGEKMIGNHHNRTNGGALLGITIGNHYLRILPGQRLLLPGRERLAEQFRQSTSQVNF